MNYADLSITNEDLDAIEQNVLDSDPTIKEEDLDRNYLANFAPYPKTTPEGIIMHKTTQLPTPIDRENYGSYRIECYPDLDFDPSDLKENHPEEYADYCRFGAVEVVISDLLTDRLIWRCSGFISVDDAFAEGRFQLDYVQGCKTN